jgi:hypothetical protein
MPRTTGKDSGHVQGQGGKDIPRKASEARNINQTNAPRPADALIQAIADLKPLGAKRKLTPVHQEASLASSAQVTSHQMTVKASMPLGM